MKQIGTIGKDPIYLAKKNEKELWRSTVLVGKKRYEGERPVMLASLSRFRPFDEIELITEW